MTHRQAIISRALLLAILAASVWFATGARCAECDVRQLWLSLADGTSIHARLYIPPSQSQPGPAVVVAHGYLANSSFMETPWASDLAGLGIVGLFLDRRGHGRSGGNLYPNAAQVPARLNEEYADVHAALAYLRAQTDLVDSNRLALLGHSDGATAALVAASADWDVAATVALSASLAPWEYVNHVVPRNLLLLYGSEDRFILNDTDRALISHATRGYLRSEGRAGALLGGGWAVGVMGLWGAGLGVGAWLAARITGLPGQEGGVVASVLGVETLFMGGLLVTAVALSTRRASMGSFGAIGRGIGAAVLVQAAIELLVMPVYTTVIDWPRAELFVLFLAIAVPAFAATCTAVSWISRRASTYVPIEVILGAITVVAATLLFVRMAAFPIIMLGITLVFAGAYRAGGAGTASVAAFASVLYARAASVVCALH